MYLLIASLEVEDSSTRDTEQLLEAPKLNAVDSNSTPSQEQHHGVLSTAELAGGFKQRMTKDKKGVERYQSGLKI